MDYLKTKSKFDIFWDQIDHNIIAIIASAFFTPGVNLINILRAAFYTRRSQTLSNVFLRFWDLRA